MARTSAKTTTPSDKETGKAPNTTPSTAAPAPARTGPAHEQIARRAYEIFLARGGQPGNPEHDWHQAERELALGRQ
ncbi:DUF2934 domain-containing protein [Hyalangium versicolor]|uniref:DUF2934 domain-containing protein n=1 Tax=Hyalangium versicolor TaxID=2861190 RepID=UPI001CCAD45F|nr:DUF2934 domain-containing protein [Hyalangium versicolor]